MSEYYRGFKIVPEYPNESDLTEFTVFVWSKSEYYKSELYGKDCEGGFVGFGSTEMEALKLTVDEYWGNNEMEELVKDMDKAINEVIRDFSEKTNMYGYVIGADSLEFSMTSHNQIEIGWSFTAHLTKKPKGIDGFD